MQKSAIRNLKSEIERAGQLPALWMHRSATGRIAPPRTDICSVLDNARYCRVPTRKREHLPLPRLIVLRVIFSKNYLVLIIMVPGLLTVRTSGFGVQY